MKVRYDLMKEFRYEQEDGKTVFTWPRAEQGIGRVPWGFDFINPSAVDVMEWYGFRFRVCTAEKTAEITVSAEFYDGTVLTRRAFIAGVGEHALDIGPDEFDMEAAKKNLWRELIKVTVEGNVHMVDALITRGKTIWADCPVRGKSARAGEEICYTAEVCNCTNKTQQVMAEQAIEGWEAVIFTAEPVSCLINPGEKAEFTFRGRMPANMVPGAHEKSRVRFVPNGDGAAAAVLEFHSLAPLSHPFIYHTREEWEETSAKIEREEKFRPGFERLKADADTWQPYPPKPIHERDYCYDTRQEHYIMCCGYLYSLTGEIKYAEKAAAFFRYFIDETDGYPVKKKGCSQSYVQEGHFFQHLALAYDMILPSGILNERERKEIERCMRIYMEILDRHIKNGHISNWIVSEVTGAVYCAMVLQDYERVSRFVFGNGGTVEHLKKGTFNDGWWHECSVGYNIWVSSMFLHTGHAMRRYGIDLIDARFEIPYNKEVSSSHPLRPAAVRYGMYNEKWGGIQKSYIGIKDLFDAPIRFLDYRAVLFAMNDSDEKRIESVHMGSTYDLAYFYYRDPAYLAVIQKLKDQDPIFGNPELTDHSLSDYELGRDCAFSDNIGIAMLRSRKEGRRPGEELQAVLRYGSHGNAHGHFDRTELLSLMRFGRSFYNPEHVWWGYGHFMYKFYVQNSNTKNMVVVDRKMQVPTDSRRILFYSGNMVSAAAVTTASKWAFPPFGGMIYDGRESLKEQCEYNQCDLNSYDAAPHGELTGFTEPVVQTRAMAVTPDYVVLFDCVQGEAEHTFESLMQIKGLLGIEALRPGGLRYTGHTGQKDTDPRSDAQFITNCDWYEAAGETRARFSTKFGPGADMRGTRMGCCEDGVLNLDVYTAWPANTVQCAGFAAEDLGVRIPYRLNIFEGDVKRDELRANAWLLGTRRMDVKLDGGTDLSLEFENLPLYTEQRYPYDCSRGLFLADAVIGYDDGSEVSVIDLPLNYENIDQGVGIGRDYEGGEVILTGIACQDAIPVSPIDHSKPGKLYIDAKQPGRRPVRFKGTIGAAAFPGDKSQRRITYGVAQTGRKARFITVIEAYESEASVRSAEGIDGNTVRVGLGDGRVQILHVEGMEDAKPVLTIEEYRCGRLTGKETASGGVQP